MEVGLFSAYVLETNNGILAVGAFATDKTSGLTVLTFRGSVPVPVYLSELSKYSAPFASLRS